MRLIRTKILNSNKHLFKFLASKAEIFWWRLFMFESRVIFYKSQLKVVQERTELATSTKGLWTRFPNTILNSEISKRIFPNHKLSDRWMSKKLIQVGVAAVPFATKVMANQPERLSVIVVTAKHEQARLLAWMSILRIHKSRSRQVNWRNIPSRTMQIATFTTASAQTVELQSSGELRCAQVGLE